MTGFIEQAGNSADALTGERIFPNERVFDTGIKNRRAPYMGVSKTRLIKEATIVWLAEQAGLKICGDDCACKSDAGVSKSAPVVEREDAGVGDGAPEVGEAATGGSKPVKRRSSGASKSK